METTEKLELGSLSSGAAWPPNARQKRTKYKTFVKYGIGACANGENDDLMRVSNAYGESLHSVRVLRYNADRPIYLNIFGVAGRTQFDKGTKNGKLQGKSHAIDKYILYYSIYLIHGMHYELNEQ